MRVRYVGAHPITFTAYGIGSVEPGDEFEVPDEVAEAFTSRSDLERVVDPSPARVSRARKPVTDEVAAPATDETVKPAEDDGGVPDDH